MEQRERAQQRAKAEREAGGEHLGPRHGYTPCNSASFAGAGDVEVPLNPNLSNLAAATAAVLRRSATRSAHAATAGTIALPSCLDTAVTFDFVQNLHPHRVPGAGHGYPSGNPMTRVSSGTSKTWHPWIPPASPDRRRYVLARGTDTQFVRRGGLGDTAASYTH